jgi:hypothetical protein
MAAKQPSLDAGLPLQFQECIVHYHAIINSRVSPGGTPDLGVMNLQVNGSDVSEVSTVNL